MKSWVEVVAQCKILPQTNAPLRSIPSIKHKEEAGASTLCAYKLTRPCPSLSLLAQFGLSSDLSAIRIHSLDILTCPFDSVCGNVNGVCFTGSRVVSKQILFFNPVN